ncbi:MAG: zinc-ribbon domain-containing protein [Bacteroidota bacterium]
MPTSDPTSCCSCGAALRPGAALCDLCGTPVGHILDPTAVPVRLGTEAEHAVEAAERADAATPTDSMTCASCGHLNPAGARFCNACGTPLMALSGRHAVPAPPPAAEEETKGERPPSDVGRQAMMFVGTAIGIVVALYALTVVFGDRRAAPPPEASVAGTATPPATGTAATTPLPEGGPSPLPDPQQAQADAFEAQGDAAGFFESARFYLTAAFQEQESNPEASRLWAHEAVTRLERSLELNEDPDVRIALAEAAGFEGVDPMRPIREAQAVLAADSTHPGANLFIGQRRLMIGRTDQAQEAFETVIANTEPGDPARATAESALEIIATRSAP